MKLYTYFRSGTSHRLRIALKLKGLSCEQVAVDLRRDEHLGEAYKAVHPQQLVPALEVDGAVMTQSPAIIEWLDERFPQPPLLPEDATERAQVRAVAAVIGCDIHPVNNRRILEALRSRFGADPRANAVAAAGGDRRGLCATRRIPGGRGQRASRRGVTDPSARLCSTAGG